MGSENGAPAAHRPPPREALFIHSQHTNTHNAKLKYVKVNTSHTLHSLHSYAHTHYSIHSHALFLLWAKLYRQTAHDSAASPSSPHAASSSKVGAGPCPRACLCMCADGMRVYIYGGFDGETDLCDLWGIDLQPAPARGHALGRRSCRGV